jgi:hypothetical protein
MKIKINKKSQKEIAKLRKIIEKHRVEEDKSIESIITSMHLKTDKEAEIVWDYIYNDSGWMVELEK